MTRLDRRAALRRGALAGGGLLFGGLAVEGLVRPASSAPSKEGDIQILQFAAGVEHVQADFYEQARKQAGLDGDALEFARVAGAHERAHLAFLVHALGPKAPPAPTVHFGATLSSPSHFAAAAIALEEATLAAYNGQGTNVTKPTLSAVARIVSVEARHAAWIRDIAGRLPAPRAADPAITPAKALHELRAAGLRTGG